MEAEQHFLRDQVQTFNSSLSQYPHGSSPQLPLQVGEGSQPVTPWNVDRSVMAPLIDKYDHHIEEMSKQLHKYQGQMADLKVKLDSVIKENERLHTELRQSVERQLHVLPVSTAAEGSAVEEETIINNLQEQIQLSEKERGQAMELWQTASQELDHLQQIYQKTISDTQMQDVQRKQLTDQLVHFQQQVQKLVVDNQKLGMTNQQFLKTLTEQTTEMEELQSNNRQSKAELRMATAKVNEMTKLLQNLQEQMQRREEDVAVAQGRENASDIRLQQLQSALGQLESRLNAATQEAETVRRAQSVYEQKVAELQARCTTLEEEKYAALTKVRVKDQTVEEATLQKEKALLREKQLTEELQKTKDTIKQLIQDAAVRTRKEVENVRKQCSVQILRMTEELSALQLECADKQSQIERSLRERKAVEEELEKVYKEGRAEPEFRKIEALHHKCLEAERRREDLFITLQSTQSKLKKMEMDYSEELSRCQEEVRRLQNSLATSREECVSISEERLKLQQENTQLRKDVDDTRKSYVIDQKKSKQLTSQLEQEYCLKERELDAQIRELEESSKRNNADVARLLAAQQKTTQRWKEEAKKLIQDFETKTMSHKSELNRQKQRSHELELQIEAHSGTIAETVAGTAAQGYCETGRLTSNSWQNIRRKPAVFKYDLHRPNKKQLQLHISYVF
uniref:Sodium channel and clathrin linker 1 n=1 Tax=Knipowitschia caucasica TaxID=637954 RepID=A0AAV2LIC3_KNICA